jgi:radical SAM-linked protein
MVCDKVRIRFRKTGDLRLISHHDLMRCCERMLRRAALPFHSTSGFNPKPRLIFAMPLPLGISGSQEIVELELDQELPLEEVHAALIRQAPPGLEILAVERIDRKTTAHVRRATYRIALDRNSDQDLAERVQSLLAADACWIERERPQHKRFNARLFVSAIRLEHDALEMELVVTPKGTVRPDEVLKLLGLEDLLEAGVLVERTKLELDEEALTPVPAPEHSEDLPAAT